jgi:signal transduction histidine kinase
MRERVEQLGGRFEVESTLGTGTAVKAIIPLGSLE